MVKSRDHCRSTLRLADGAGLECYEIKESSLQVGQANKWRIFSRR
jgi:hypothetical protein